MTHPEGHPGTGLSCPVCDMRHGGTVEDCETLMAMEAGLFVLQPGEVNNDLRVLTLGMRIRALREEAR